MINNLINLVGLKGYNERNTDGTFIIQQTQKQPNLSIQQLRAASTFFDGANIQRISETCKLLTKNVPKYFGFQNLFVYLQRN